MALMFSTGEFQAVGPAERGFDVTYAIPGEGGIGWLDTFALSAGRKTSNVRVPK